MAAKRKKKRRKRKSKYAVTIGKTMVSKETSEQMCAKFPAKLVKAFIKVRETDFENEKVYRAFAKLERAYLGDEADDRIESGKLIVLLAKATMDMFDNKKVVFCKEHPKYGAIRKPRKDCKVCWDMYNAKRKTK